MLDGFAVHGVRLEPLARRALDDWCRRHGARLRETIYADFLADLVFDGWKLADRWQPGRGPAFSTYAYRILYRRVTDCYRRHPEFGDSRHAERPEILSIEKLIEDDVAREAVAEDDRLEHDSGRGRLASPLASLTMDGPEARTNAYRWFLAEGDSELPRDSTASGGGEVPVAPRRDRRPSGRRAA